MFGGANFPARGIAAHILNAIKIRNAAIVAEVTFLIFIAFNIWAAIPRAGKFAPPNINDFNVLLNAKDSTDLTVGIILTVMFTAAFLISGIILFNKQEL
jgi:hypothetical protein